MLVIGLTGSIGMGKSTVAKRFAARGVAVCDADAVVHDLYAGEARAPIEVAFPGTVIDGVVDRAKLSAALLDDPTKFKTLEAIVHPLVKAKEVAFLNREVQSGAACAVLEVPLLFETHGDARVDVTVVVSAPADVQRQRVLERDGMTNEKLDHILSRQVPDSEKRRRADFVVDTGLDLDGTFAQVDRIVEALKIRKGTAFQSFWASG